jgi:hypothetical protein
VRGMLQGMLPGMLRFAALALVSVGLSYGTTVSNCFLDTVGVSCYTQGLFSFSDSLDWGAAVSGSGQSGLGTAFASASNPHNTAGDNPWLARTTNGIDIQTTLGASFTGGARLLTRLDNTEYVWNNTYFAWDTTVSDTSPALGLKTFAGHFAGIDPITHLGSDASHPYGDHLLGSINGNGPIELSFGADLAALGFHVASYHTSDFDATLNTYLGTTLVHTYTIHVTGGGGVCTALVPESPNDTAPVPCNDAAFIGIGTDGARFNRATIITSDMDGFLINNLYALDAPALPQDAPEPAVPLLIGGGLAALALLKRLPSLAKPR